MKKFSNMTTTTLARICGVSQGTVDRALHNRDGISKKTKEKILSVAREYQYLPRVNGSTCDKSMLIGVVLFDLYNDFFSKLAMSLVEAAKRDDYSVIFLFSNKELNQERNAVDYFNYVGVDGIILFPVGSDETQYKEYLHTIKKPIVTIGNPLFDLPYIGIDNQRATYSLTQKMLDIVKGKISYFAPILKKRLHEKNAQFARRDGFIAAMNEFGREYDVITDIKNLNATDDAIICSTDHYLLTVLKTFGFNLKPKLAGFDNTPMLDYLDKEILTVGYSTEEIAKECFNYFLRRKYRKTLNYAIVSNKKPSANEKRN